MTFIFFIIACISEIKMFMHVQRDMELDYLISPKISSLDLFSKRKSKLFCVCFLF